MRAPLTLTLLFLSACGGGGGKYDGPWTMTGWVLTDSSNRALPQRGYRIFQEPDGPLQLSAFGCELTLADMGDGTHFGLSPANQTCTTTEAMPPAGGSGSVPANQAIVFKSGFAQAQDQTQLKSTSLILQLTGTAGAQTVDVRLAGVR